MILVDANILIYAHLAGFPQHAGAKPWLDDRLNGATPVGLPWPSLLAFLRISTNPRIVERPITTQEGWLQVGAWLGCDLVWIPSPTDRHRSALEPLLMHSGVGAHLIPDAHLAALAIEHGLELCSADSDFARFAGLRWSNPLAG